MPGIRTLVANAPDGLPRTGEIGIDPLVLLFTLGISLLAGLLFGLLPVMKFATPHLASALKEGGRLSSAGRERHRARNGLVVAEIALAVVLLVASGLMIRTFQAMRDVKPGFVRPEEVLTLRVSIPESLIADDEQAIRTHEQIVRKLEQMPGVRSVGVSNSITMDGNDSNDPIFVEDFPHAGRQDSAAAPLQVDGAELLPDDGQPDRRGPRDDVGRRLQPGVGRDGQRELRPRVLEGAGGRDRQAHPADAE